MTNIQAECKDDKFILIVDGHTGYGNVGSDILCAAVSILVQTLISIIDGMDECQYDIGEGYAYVTGHGQQAVDAYRYTMSGLNLLQVNYPRFISIKGYPKL